MTDKSRRQFLRDMGATALAVSAGSGLAGATGLAQAAEQGNAGPAAGGDGPGLEVRSVAPDVEAITSYVPLPSLGLVPVSAFLIRSAEPVLVDTGLAATRAGFMEKLRGMIALEDLRWLWLTHTDADHTGSLDQVLAEAPNARLVTTFLGMGKLGLLEHPVGRAYLLNPGQSLDVGDRQLLAVKPPSFDAPETTGLMDTSTKVLFPADCFGALVKAPAEDASDISAADLQEGLVTWATVDAPWLQVVSEDKFGESLGAIRSLEPSTILSSHLPPATGMTDVLLQHLAAARTAPCLCRTGPGGPRTHDVGRRGQVVTKDRIGSCPIEREIGRGGMGIQGDPMKSGEASGITAVSGEAVVPETEYGGSDHNNAKDEDHRSSQRRSERDHVPLAEGGLGPSSFPEILRERVCS